MWEDHRGYHYRLMKGRHHLFRARHMHYQMLCAKRLDDVVKMHQRIVEFFQKDLVEAELFLPWTARSLRGEIYANCQILGERSKEEDAFFKIRVNPMLL